MLKTHTSFDKLPGSRYTDISNNIVMSLLTFEERKIFGTEELYSFYEYLCMC